MGGGYGGSRRGRGGGLKLVGEKEEQSLKSDWRLAGRLYRFAMGHQWTAEKAGFLRRAVTVQDGEQQQRKERTEEEEGARWNHHHHNNYNNDNNPVNSRKCGEDESGEELMKLPQCLKP